MAPTCAIQTRAGPPGAALDVPKCFQDDWWVTNGMLMFDDMTLDNGPTRVVPDFAVVGPDQRALHEPRRLGTEALPAEQQKR